MAENKKRVEHAKEFTCQFQKRMQLHRGNIYGHQEYN